MGISFTPELIRLLSEKGCYFERRGKGDHDVWFSPITQLRFPVDNKIKAHGKRCSQAGRLEKIFLKQFALGSHPSSFKGLPL